MERGDSSAIEHNKMNAIHQTLRGGSCPHFQSRQRKRQSSRWLQVLMSCCRMHNWMDQNMLGVIHVKSSTAISSSTVRKGGGREGRVLDEGP